MRGQGSNDQGKQQNEDAPPPTPVTTPASPNYCGLHHLRDARQKDGQIRPNEKYVSIIIVALLHEKNKNAQNKILKQIPLLLYLRVPSTIRVRYSHEPRNPIRTTRYCIYQHMAHAITHANIREKSRKCGIFQHLKHTRKHCAATQANRGRTATIQPTIYNPVGSLTTSTAESTEPLVVKAGGGLRQGKG